jgi:hypothetical protein
MALYAQDTFADSDGTDLTAHVGQLDATWALHPSSVPGVTAAWRVSDGGRAYSTSQSYATSHYLMSGVAAGTE